MESVRLRLRAADRRSADEVAHHSSAHHQAPVEEHREDLRHLKQPRAIYEPEVEDDLRHLQQHRAIYEPEVYAGILDKEVADYGEEGDSANQKCVEAELDELAPAGKS